MNLLSVQCVHLSAMLYFHAPASVRGQYSTSVLVSGGAPCSLFLAEQMAWSLLKASPHLTCLFFQLQTVHSAFRKKTRLNCTDLSGRCLPLQTPGSRPCLPHSVNWLQLPTPGPVFCISRPFPCSYLLDHLHQAS